MAPEELDGLSQEVANSVPEGVSEGSEAPVASSSTNGGERETVDADITPFDRRATLSPAFARSNPIAEASEPGLAITEDTQGTSSNIGTWVGGTGSLAGLPNSEEDEVVISPTAFTGEQTDDVGAAVSAEMTDETQTQSQTVQDGQAPIPAPLPLPPPPVSDTQPPRQFPPPGTLVVVQGVVHTTDVARPSPTPASHTATPSPPNTYLTGNPRRASSYIPRTPTPLRPESSYPRSRRSSVIPRPSGMRSRPTSMLEGSSIPASVVESSTDSESTVNSDGDLTPVSSGSGSGTRTSLPSEPGTPVLSPSSIDVLGTLLRYGNKCHVFFVKSYSFYRISSVAAAATAASLLTGSSDPIFTSGLNAPPNPSINVPLSTPNINNTNNFDRPTSPTPTTSLGNFGSLSGLGLGVPEDAPPGYGGGRERMRHVWGSLRERLGRRTAGNGSGSGDINGGEQQPDTNSRTGPNGTPADAREIMLAEMARAFNLGLGLSRSSTPDAGAGASNDGGSGEQEPGGPPPAASPAPPSTTRPELPLPVEGSFERFLVDLQADLRVALSAHDPPPSQLPYTQRSNHETSIPDINSLPSPPSHSRPTTVFSQDSHHLTEEAPPNSSMPSMDSPVIQTGATSTEAGIVHDPDLPALVPLPPTDTGSSRPELEGHQELSERDVLPPLSPSFSQATRADSESDAGGDLPETSEAPRVPHNPSPSREGVIVGSGSMSRTERRPGGGINWWRSYRFPPITAPHAHGLSTTLNSTNTTPAPLPATHLSDSASETTLTPSPLASPNPSTQNPGHGASPPTAENRPNVVVPVIVVGLQSVGMDRGRDQPPPFGEDPTFGANHNEPEPSGLAGDINLDGMPTEGDSPRARTWHSRAANAFRNLRAGRRASRVPQTNEGPGSRTFLIYVIGGELEPCYESAVTNIFS